MASQHEDSSESDCDTEPAKCFHRRLSTNKDIRYNSFIKEGFLNKQNGSFQRWHKRYFKLKSGVLYYSKDKKSTIFNQIDLIDSSIAERSLKNINHSFQVITPFRNLVLCAATRSEMKEWVSAIRAAATKDFREVTSEMAELSSLSDHHNWCVLPNIRPIFCNVCGESIHKVTRTGVTINGLACEVCKFRTHKKCASKSPSTCKWSTLASMGGNIIEDDNGDLVMPHQWMAGNFPVSSRCLVCERPCSSMLKLQDYWCLWCHGTVHTACRDQTMRCGLGPARVSILPPISITNFDEGGFWRATKSPNTSPLLVFLNSKSGDSQGVKMLRRFKQLLNPAQVFDLMNGGPKMGLRLFQNFESFRVLVCGGDGSVGWVLNEIDRLGLHKQCQVGVLPLGTGNDLSRVLGWGASFDDDAQLPALLEKLEHAQIQMFDRWSIFSYETDQTRNRSLPIDPICAYEDTASNHLSRILNSESHNVVISSAMVLCGIVQDLVSKVGFSMDEQHQHSSQQPQQHNDEDDDYDDDLAGMDKDSMAYRCHVLNQKMEALLRTLADESTISQSELEIQRRNALQIDKWNSTSSQPPPPPLPPQQPPPSSSSPSPSAVQSSVVEPDALSPSPIQDRETTTTTTTTTTNRNNIIVSTATPSSSSSSSSSSFPPRASSATTSNLCLRHVTVDVVAASSSPPPPPPPSSSSNQPDCHPGSPGPGSDPNAAVGPPHGVEQTVARSLPGQKGTVRSREQLMCRANSLKKAIRQIVELTEKAVDEQNHQTTQFERDNERRSASSPEREQQGESAPGSNLPPPAAPSSPPIQTELPPQAKVQGHRPLVILTSFIDENPTRDLSPQDQSRDLVPGQSRGDALFPPPPPPPPPPSASAPSRSASRAPSREPTPIFFNYQLCDTLPTSHLLGVPVKTPSKSPSGEGFPLPSHPLETLTFAFPMPPGSKLSPTQVYPAGCTETASSSVPVCNIPSVSVVDDTILDNEVSLVMHDADGLEKSRLLLQVPGAPGEANHAISPTHLSPAQCHSGYHNQHHQHHHHHHHHHSDGRSHNDNYSYRQHHHFNHSHHQHQHHHHRHQQSNLHNHLQQQQQQHPDDQSEAGHHLHVYSSSDGEVSRSPTPGRLSPRSPLNHHVNLVDRWSPLFGMSADRTNSPSPCFFDQHQQQQQQLNHAQPAEEKPSSDNPCTTTTPCSSHAGAGRHLSSLSTMNKAAPSRAATVQGHRAGEGVQFPLLNVPLLQSLPKQVIGKGRKSSPIHSSLISRALMANADALCAPASPLNDLGNINIEDFSEKCVMNNYFGIGLDAKITLDFHNKREEQPHKCRSRTKNMMWYGVLGGREILQRTHRNLDQKVRLECDGRLIPLPNLQGIVILNIPSYMGGINFWGGSKEDEYFVAPSFDDKVLEVVAVFGSIQLGISRVINIQRHRIAQCRSVRITIIGDEGLPVQVDGEAWIQNPGVILVQHKNRAQVLIRDRAFEEALKNWTEKQKVDRAPTREPPLSESEAAALASYAGASRDLLEKVKVVTSGRSGPEVAPHAQAVKFMELLVGGNSVSPMLFKVGRTEVMEFAGHVRSFCSDVRRSICENHDGSEDIEGSDGIKNVLEFLDSNHERIHSVGAQFYERVRNKDRLKFLFRLSKSSRRNKEQSRETSKPEVMTIRDWTQMEVAQWLNALDLPEYAESFLAHDIRGSELLALGRTDLKELGVVKVGHLKRILQEVKAIKERLKSHEASRSRKDISEDSATTTTTTATTTTSGTATGAHHLPMLQVHPATAEAEEEKVAVATTSTIPQDVPEVIEAKDGNFLSCSFSMHQVQSSSSSSPC